jgi:hypothetical protein
MFPEGEMKPTKAEAGEVTVKNAAVAKTAAAPVLALRIAAMLTAFTKFSV